MRKLITITVGALNSDYDYAIAEKIGVTVIMITDYDCNRTDPWLWETTSAMLLIKTRNRKGPSTLPWGTPYVTGAASEASPSSTTRWDRSVRK